MFKESVRMSLSNITNNKMRSLLTTLGILIGVTAIIALITVVQSATGAMTEQFAAMGTGKLTVSANGTALKKGLTQNDLDDLLAIDNVAGISPTVNLTAGAKSDFSFEEEVAVEGKNDLYFRQDDTLVARGRALNILDIQDANRVCIIDEPLKEKLFYGQNPIGQELNIGGITHIVVGLLSDSGNADVMSQAMGGSTDGKVIIPYTAAQKMSGSHNVTSLEVYLTDTDKTDETIAALERVLSAAFNDKEDSYSVINMQSLLDSMNTMISMMTVLLAGIAAISLLVGGIGIMNMMLVSVTERTGEIGLRKALGAQPGQIQLQFLIESFILSLLGGLIGALLGITISIGLCALLGTAFSISWGAVGLGIGFSAVVGILFGWAPARNASNLNPIDALRSV